MYADEAVLELRMQERFPNITSCRRADGDQQACVALQKYFNWRLMRRNTRISPVLQVQAP